MPQQIRLAINGVGRLGRQVFRAVQERLAEGWDLVAVRDCMPIELLAHLLERDSTHGLATFSVELLNEFTLLIDGKPIVYQRSPSVSGYLEWPEVDVVLECTGSFSKLPVYAQRTWIGTQKVIISAPAESVAQQVVVLGANDAAINPDLSLFSAGSCTTHALAVTLTPLLRHISLRSVAVTELHGFTHDQKLLDGAHDDWRRARGATQSMIPTRTAGIGTIETVLPELSQRVLGYSMRVPVVNGAAVDLTIQCDDALADVSLARVLQWYEEAADQWKERYGRPLLGIERSPLVSSDYIDRSESAIIDVERLVMQGNTLRLLAWFDNEVGYAHRLLDLAKIIL